METPRCGSVLVSAPVLLQLVGTRPSGPYGRPTDLQPLGVHSKGVELSFIYHQSDQRDLVKFVVIKRTQGTFQVLAIVLPIRCVPGYCVEYGPRRDEIFQPRLLLDLVPQSRSFDAGRWE